MVYQHFSLFDTLTAAENVWLGLDKSLSLADVVARIREVAGVYGLDVDPLRPVHTLSVGERQRVEIVRALMTVAQAPDPRRADLGADAAGGADAVRDAAQARRRRVARSSTSRTSSTRSGPRATTARCCAAARSPARSIPTKETNASLSRLMIGAEPPQLQHREPHLGDVVLSVRGLTLAKEDPFGTALDAVSFDVRAGEVVGIAGVSGNGQQELMAAISGEDRRAPAGSIRLFERRHRPRLAAQAPRRRIALRSRGATRSRRGADAVAGAEHAPDANAARSAPAAGCASATSWRSPSR